jgi:FHA domain
MARIFGKVFGTGPGGGARSRLARARDAELRGELALAAALFAEAMRPDEVARVMVARGDAETDPAARVRHYAQALATAPPHTAPHAHARHKHASALVDVAARGPLTAASKRDLAYAASELEAVGDHARAAQAYAHAGDLEGQARALGQAGDVEALEALLASGQKAERDGHARRAAYNDVTLLVASGQRREAVATARTCDDEGVRELGRTIERRRLAWGRVHVVLGGQDIVIVPGDEVVLGRGTEASVSNGSEPAAVIPVASPTVSRRHLLVSRRASGVVVRDLGSRHGTLHRGRPLDGETPIEAGIDLCLGRDVRVVVGPAIEIAGAVAIEVAGTRFVAPLGPARLGVGRWELERGHDGWIELATCDDPPAFVQSLRVAATMTLLAGDEIAAARGGPIVLRVAEHGA